MNASHPHRSVIQQDAPEGVLTTKAALLDAPLEHSSRYVSGLGKVLSGLNREDLEPDVPYHEVEQVVAVKGDAEHGG
ncbi:hypothetical protein [Humibacillus sp. DSM 29435]|uniref:hypothetical protein n=1 Tax=Humibacillus sp. DSM 29435 TaxID=1869167 RepID=UPI00111314E0|nr:hypothetical protein [Humibacillus sp. DSM 29435]